MSGKRGLPLDDPRWMSSTEMHRQRSEHVGDPQLAARDLTEAHRSKRIRSMRRPICRDADDPDHERLSPSFWTEYEYWWWAPTKALTVRPRGGGSPGPDGFISRAYFYVYFGWGPDFDEVWWSGVTISTAVVADEKETEQTKRLRLPSEFAAALNDAAPDKANKGKVQEPRRQRQIAQAIIDRCFPHNMPGTATVLRKIVDEWKPELLARKMAPTSIDSPTWHTVNRMLGRE